MTKDVDIDVADRRRALRVQLRTHGSLITDESSCETHLINLSQAGALVAVLEPHKLKAGDAVGLEIALPGGHLVLMEGSVVHVKGHMLGLNCTPVTDTDAVQIKAIIEQMSDQ